MPLIVDWVKESSAVISKIVIPIFDVHLVLTLNGAVVVDASWQLVELTTPCEPLNETGLQVQRYLLDPNVHALRIKLLMQGSVYCHRVWNVLLGVPMGQVMTYTELAQAVGSAPRAVARACRDNPYAGIIPCHRIVAKSGLGGFMGQRQGEMVELKRHILGYERCRG